MMDGATIVAIATPPGEGGIGVVRLSGDDAAAIARRVFRQRHGDRPPALRSNRSHRLIYGRVIDPTTDEPIDEALLAWMAAPHTYTREDTVELSCHGGVVPVRETLRVLLAAGARHAEPGEVSLRAFLNGRLDLMQAEAVLNVVGARTTEGLRLAVADLGGELGQRLRPARDLLVGLLAYLDAAADFPDDEIPPTDVVPEIAAADAVLVEVLAGARAGMLYREGAQVALVGRPNVGKSSLLNALLRAERAIVTPVPGTTRDIIAETVNLGGFGFPVTLLDTAGIAETVDLVERLGIDRSRRVIDAAVAAVLVLDGSVPPGSDDLTVATMLAARGDRANAPPAVVIAINKRDLLSVDQAAVVELLPGCPVVEIAATSGMGIPALEAALAGQLRGEGAGLARPALITARQRAALDRSLEHLRDAVATHATGHPLDLLATDIRAALRAIGEVTGEAIDDAVLTEIFARFCIGK